MLDVSANLYNALPQAFGAARRTPSSNSLVKRDENLSGGNSLRTVSSQLQPETAIADFSPKSANEQGFGSLTPVLASLRLQPEQLVADSTDEAIPVWKQLLDEQQRISEARELAFQDAQDRLAERRRRETEIEASQQRIDNNLDRSVASAETQADTAATSAQTESGQQGIQTANSSAAEQQQAVNLLNAGDAQPEFEPAPLPGQTQTLFPSQGTEQAPLPDLFGNTDKVSFESDPQPVFSDDQQRIEQLFNSAPDTPAPGNTINLFA